MKTLFLKDGVVVSHGSTSDMGAAISCNIPGATSYAVADDSPADVDWTYTAVDGVIAFTAPVPAAPKVSPVQFKLLFAPAERVAMGAAQATDPVLQDFFGIVNDPRLTFVDLGLQSTKDAITYLVGKNLITQARSAEILAGIVK